MNSLFLRWIERPRNAILFLIGLSAMFYIGLGHVHLFDWDEINFAESAREMISSGDYMRVQINYSPFWEKPPLFFWLQVISMKVFGVNEFAARFPNAVFGTIYLCTFYIIGRKHISALFGIFWAILFFSTLLPHIYFKSGIIDPVFNFFIFLSLYNLMLVLSEDTGQNKNAILSGIFSGLSVLTKGPVGFLLLALCFLVFTILSKGKSTPRLKYFLYFIIGFLGLVCSWLLVELYQNGTENMIKFMEYQAELFSSPVAGHEQPFYYHFLVVFIGCFPISIYAIPSLMGTQLRSPIGFQKWMQILFWVVIILFSISTTKIIHYSSMTYIPLSFLAALYLYRVWEGNLFWRQFMTWLYLGLGLLWGCIFITVPLILKYTNVLLPYIKDDFAKASLNTPVNWTGYESITGVVLIAGVLWSLHYLKKNKIIHGLFIFAASINTTLLLTTYLILPKIEAFTQGPVVRFYQQISQEEAYIESYGYKSYAQYFYANQKYGKNEKRKDLNWLKFGQIDKPVYFVSKSTNTELDNVAGFRLIKTEGGFRFYKRNPK